MGVPVPSVGGNAGRNGNKSPSVMSVLPMIFSTTEPSTQVSSAADDFVLYHPVNLRHTLLSLGSPLSGVFLYVKKLFWATKRYKMEFLYSCEICLSTMAT